MEVFECIRKRRAIGCIAATLPRPIHFKDTPVPDAVLEQVLEAGRWAPSSLNTQPVELVVVRDKARLNDIRKLIRCGWDIEIGWDAMEQMGGEEGEAAHNAWLDKWERIAYDAPVMIIVAADSEKRDTLPYSSTAFFSMSSDAACAAIMNIMLAARALDLGTVWATFPNPYELKTMLKIPKTLGIAGVIPLGYPTEWPEDVAPLGPKDPRFWPRRPLKNMVHQGRFDEEKWHQYRTVFTYGPVLGKDRYLERRLNT
jgi:nitroreductase